MSPPAGSWSRGQRHSADALTCFVFCALQRLQSCKKQNQHVVSLRGTASDPQSLSFGSLGAEHINGEMEGLKVAAPQSHSQHGTGSTGNSPAAVRQHPPVLGSSPSSSCSSVPTKQNRESVKHLQTSPQSPPGSVDMPPSLAAHPRLCRNAGDGEGGGKWYPPAASNPPPAPC